jgi:hypothetical protein
MLRIMIATQDLVDGIHEVSDTHRLQFVPDSGTILDEFLADPTVREVLTAFLLGKHGEGERVVLERFD